MKPPAGLGDNAPIAWGCREEEEGNVAGCVGRKEGVFLADVGSNYTCRYFNSNPAYPTPRYLPLTEATSDSSERRARQRVSFWDHLTSLLMLREASLSQSGATAESQSSTRGASKS